MFTEVFVHILYSTRSDTIYLDHQTSLHSYTFKDVEKYTVNGMFYIQFTVEVMDENAVIISDESSVRLD